MEVGVSGGAAGTEREKEPGTVPVGMPGRGRERAMRDKSPFALGARGQCGSVQRSNVHADVRADVCASLCTCVCTWLCSLEGSGRSSPCSQDRSLPRGAAPPAPLPGASPPASLTPWQRVPRRSPAGCRARVPLQAPQHPVDGGDLGGRGEIWLCRQQGARHHGQGVLRRWERGPGEALGWRGHPEPAPRQGGIEADAPMFVPQGLSCGRARVTKHLSTCQGLSVLGTCPSAPNGAICRGAGDCGVIVVGLWLQHTALSRAGCTLSPLRAGALVADPSLQQPNARADTRLVCADLAQRQHFSSPPCPRLFSSGQEAPGAAPSPLPSLGFGSCCASPLGWHRARWLGADGDRSPGQAGAVPAGGLCCFLLQAVVLAPLLIPTIQTSLLLAAPPSIPACPIPPPQYGTPTHQTPAMGSDPAWCLTPAPPRPPWPGLTLGVLSLAQTPSACSCCRISQAKSAGCSRFSCAIRATTSGVAVRGLLPPMALGSTAPVW